MASDIIPDQYDRYILAILFAALFASISWIAPMLYITFTEPADHFEIQSVEVSQDNNTTHNLTVEHEAREKTPVEAEITLLESTADDDIVVRKWETSRVIPSGDQTRSTTLHMQEPVDEGEYYYRFDVVLYLDYNVKKEYEYETDAFPIEDGNQTHTAMVCCAGIAVSD